jgi:hypothetical protein
MLIPADPKDPLNPKPDYLNSLEASGKWVAEQKWNGDNILINTNKPKEIWNRHKALLTRYKMNDEVQKELLSLYPPDTLINGELMNNHTKDTKDLIIVHCIMILSGVMVRTWGDSRRLLDRVQSGKYFQISRVWTKGFWDLYQTADGKTIEGIILKDPNGKLVFSTTPIKDVPWMLKIRKPCKKYQF